MGISFRECLAACGDEKTDRHGPGTLPLFILGDGARNAVAPFLRAVPMSLPYPPTVIVRHPRENPRKCSVLPLRGRPDLIFLPFPVRELPDLTGYVRLAAEGPELSVADGAAGVLLLDGSWRRAAAMTRVFADISPRSLHGWQTAYPRVSKLGTDPDNGLASVEALYIAHHILGRPTEGLLDHYRWGAEFLEINGLARVHEG
jgi:pre-rRNA-processing protein TSR3